MSKIKSILIPSKPKKRKRRMVLYIILLFLVAVRIWLPYFLKDRLVAAVNKSEGYECQLDDLDLALFRGAMILEGFKIQVTTNNIKKPFVYVESADISVEWRSLLKGAIVSEIYIDKPNLYFADGDEKEEKQAGGASWVKPVIEFIPLKINSLTISDGTVEFENAVSNPEVNLKLTELNLIAENLTNSTESKDSLPSRLNLTSRVLGNGFMELNGNLNILKEIPDMDLNFNIKQVNLTRLNDFTMAYANFDFERGEFALASEFAMINKEIKGYIKPVLNHVKVFDFDEKGTTLNKFWQAFIGLSFNVTKNQTKDRSATKVPFSGKYNDPDIELIKTIINVIKNAIIEAYEAKVDNSISPEDINAEKDNSNFWKQFKELFSN